MVAPGTNLDRYESAQSSVKVAMGEVHLTRDTELDRTVAAKIPSCLICFRPTKIEPNYSGSKVHIEAVGSRHMRLAKPKSRTLTKPSEVTTIVALFRPG